MDAFVITLKGDEYSMQVAARCIQTAETVGGIKVEHFPAIDRRRARAVMGRMGLDWTWGKSPKGMNHHRYGGSDDARIGCALSHLMLWCLCIEKGQPLLILEHDAVFVSEFSEFEFDTACMINDPQGATPRGDWWHDQMVARGPGVWPKTRIFDDRRPDGLAGNSAYVIKPQAAEKLTALVDEYGLWPNDAIMCRQFIDLQERYPFITEVQAERSTIQ